MALQLESRIRPHRLIRSDLLMTSRSDRVLRIRAGCAADEPQLAALAAQLSSETRRLRWFVPLPAELIVQQWRQTLQSDPAQTLLVAQLIRRPRPLVAVAQLAVSRAEPSSAEIALVVRDDDQRDGIGLRLCQTLVQIGRRRGLRQLTANVLSENRGMLQLVRRLGLPTSSARRDGATELRIELPPR